MGDERTDRIHVPDGSFGAFVAGPHDGTVPAVLLLTFRIPACILEG